MEALRKSVFFICALVLCPFAVAEVVAPSEVFSTTTNRDSFQVRAKSAPEDVPLNLDDPSTLLDIDESQANKNRAKAVDNSGRLPTLPQMELKQRLLPEMETAKPVEVKPLEPYKVEPEQIEVAKPTPMTPVSPTLPMPPLMAAMNPPSHTPVFLPPLLPPLDTLKKKEGPQDPAREIAQAIDLRLGPMLAELSLPAVKEPPLKEPPAPPPAVVATETTKKQPVPPSTPMAPLAGVPDVAIILSNNQFFPARIRLKEGIQTRLIFTTVNKKPAALVVERLQIQRWIAKEKEQVPSSELERSKWEVNREISSTKITEITLEPKKGSYAFHDAISGAAGEITVE